MVWASLIPVAAELLTEYVSSDDTTQDKRLQNLTATLNQYQGGSSGNVDVDEPEWMNFLPLAFELVELYCSSSQTKADDRILKHVQNVSQYLAESETNTLGEASVQALNAVQMLTTKKDDGI